MTQQESYVVLAKYMFFLLYLFNYIIFKYVENTE